MNTEQVKNATISEETRGWMSCIAQLDELYNNIYDKLSEQYTGRQVEAASAALREPYNAFRSALLGYMTDCINDNLHDMSSTQI